MAVAQLHPIIDNTLKYNGSRMKDAVKRGSLQNFTDGDFVLVAREVFHSG